MSNAGHNVEFVGGPWDGERWCFVRLERLFFIPYRTQKDTSKMFSIYKQSQEIAQPIGHTLIYELRNDKSRPYYLFLRYGGPCGE